MHVGSNVKIKMSIVGRRPVVRVLKRIAFPSQKSERRHEFPRMRGSVLLLFSYCAHLVGGSA